MFDPTAFENIRVVLEGTFYDMDLAGNLIIIDRNDLINTAKLSRTYDFSFRLTASQQVIEPKITCKVTLSASLENLAAELLSNPLLMREAGCVMQIEYMFEYEEDEFTLKQIEKILRTWKNTTYKQMITYEPLKKRRKIKHHELISCDHILKEEDMNELPDIANQIMSTLLQIEKVINR
ncbi:hypothetical protein [Niallia sp. Krafla_26]|uniref:hypothetical protein n=1 Tax=Niallia sp. Krafla_26 TaxID=3064703 RepID=UPI003D16807C